MKAIVFERFGEPREVLQVREVSMPAAPAAGQVRVRMRMSPINPSDLMTVRGMYGRLPTLPATPGFEGVGVIDAVGSGWLAKLRGIKPGRRVAVLNSKGGNWQEYVDLPARQVVPIPDDLPDDQVAAFFVNPATAVIMMTAVSGRRSRISRNKPMPSSSGMWRSEMTSVAGTRSSSSSATRPFCAS